MKTILLSLFCAIALSASAQTGTTTPDYRTSSHYGNDPKTWVFFPLDTISAESAPDTIISGGDTSIIDYPDTVIVTFRKVFANDYNGIIKINMDTIQAFADLTGTLEILSAPCVTCDYDVIKTITLPDVDTYTRDTFQLQDVIMQLRIIGTAGFGKVQSWVTLKPSCGSW